MFCSNRTAPVAPKEEQMRRPRRNHTPAFKAKVAVAAVKGEKTLAQLAEQFGPSVMDLQAKIGQLTMENDVLERALDRVHGPSAKR